MSDEYTIERLKTWQDAILELAKKMLRKDGELRPVAFILTEKMNIEEHLQEASQLLNSKSGGEITSLADADDVKPSDTVVLVVDLVMHHDTILDTLKHKLTPEEGAVVDSLIEQGHRFGATDPARTVANVLMKRMGLEYKDLVALFIEQCIKRTEAIAYMKLDETWVLEQPVGKADIEEYYKTHSSLEDHPQAREAITLILETTDFTRMVSVKFNRNRPKTGRIIGFEDPPFESISDSTTTAEHRSAGRFANLFSKAKALPKPLQSPHAN